LRRFKGLNIQTSSARLFENNSSPGGILTAPGEIKNSTAERLKADWEQNFSGKNVGRVAVLGDGLKYEKMALTAVEGQLIEQLKWSAEIVCSTFHVPPYKIGIKDFPARMDLQAMNVEYYSQSLQSLIEAAELCLDEGLNTGNGLGVEFDIEGLLRMDTCHSGHGGKGCGWRWH
jgi:HK97 family phage portal protein